MDDHKYKSILSDAQREALAVAYLDDGIRPARRVCELAARGALELDGARLEPYEASVGQLHHSVKRWRKVRSGLAHSGVAGLPAADAVEVLRQRLVKRADAELRAMERPGSKVTEKSAERLTRVAKLVREIAALPGPKDPRPTTSPSRAQGRDPAPTSMAGEILKAQRGVGVYERPEPEPEPEHAPVLEDPVMAWAAEQIGHANGFDHFEEDGDGEET